MAKYKIKDLRFWGKNPRYTNFKNVKILEIGKDDFDDDGRDLYLNNLQEYYKNLIKNKRMIDKLLELVENIAYSGFEADTDEILITTSPYLMEMDINKFSSLYYVLEGNRRLFSLFLLLDLYNSRQALKRTISDSQYDKFQKIFNNSKFKDKEIECKVFNVKEKGEKYTRLGT